MENINPEMLKHGYLIIPKLMLQKFNDKSARQDGDFEAFLKMLMKVNYTDIKTDTGTNKDIVCRRGESLYSYRDWSKVFGWAVSRTFRFISKLSRSGIIELIDHRENRNILHIRINEYDRWTGNTAAYKEHRSATDERFRIFWDEYHRITLLPKENIGKAQREWKKLPAKEQKLAIERIEEYYYHLTDTQFTLRACNYLSNKAYLNEYDKFIS
ncbi:hypothetical protein HMPREF1981_02500 [Bacteroides pyogenes F0041]|uniref:Uncharacterized protein n=1 Tax=Bacteroides pyogenes F0041 TaxID=1321819 RepID=U2DWL1_9BACE|nr:hypothetical protein [Bacteroides pyogenes]ERI84191.1 hypothetical protein HMPREF1981_02500 [Bacteroides pyogenes F0041]MBB3893878.1 hypothetical protein [Bacteroides pyogenes]SUV33906.1 Uncharacterised protein [Bacteroides pyogenes]